MNKKQVVVEIEDLREFVGGGADVAVQNSDVSGTEFVFPSNTIMCYRFKEPAQGADWTVVKGK